jgi:hypothetical protein
MPEYRAFIIGRDGLFQKAIGLEAVDDAHAIEQAKQYVDGHDVELWQLGRRVIRLKSESQGKA